MRMNSSPITVVAASCARLGFPLPNSCPTRVLAAPVHHTSMVLVPQATLLPSSVPLSVLRQVPQIPQLHNACQETPSSQQSGPYQAALHLLAKIKCPTSLMLAYRQPTTSACEHGKSWSFAPSAPRLQYGDITPHGYVRAALTAHALRDGVRQSGGVEAHAHGRHRHVSVREPSGHEDEALVQPPLQAARPHRG